MHTRGAGEREHLNYTRITQMSIHSLFSCKRWCWYHSRLSSLNCILRIEDSSVCTGVAKHFCPSSQSLVRCSAPFTFPQMQTFSEYRSLLNWTSFYFPSLQPVIFYSHFETILRHFSILNWNYWHYRGCWYSTSSKTADEIFHLAYDISVRRWSTTLVIPQKFKRFCCNKIKNVFL